MSIAFEPKNTRFSLKNAYALALCSQLAYEPPQVINDKLKQQGFDSVFINSENKDTQAFIAYNETAVVLAFRGTTSIKDWMTDANPIASRR